MPKLCGHVPLSSESKHYTERTCKHVCVPGLGSLSETEPAVQMSSQQEAPASDQIREGELCCSLHCCQSCILSVIGVNLQAL